MMTKIIAIITCYKGIGIGYNNIIRIFVTKLLISISATETTTRRRRQLTGLYSKEQLSWQMQIGDSFVESQRAPKLQTCVRQGD